MKKYLMMLVAVLSLWMAAPACAQQHRHTQGVQQATAVSDSADDDNAAYSDTTGAADDDSMFSAMGNAMQQSVINAATSGAEDDSLGGWGTFPTLVIVAIVISFLILPVVLLGLLFYFIYKSRRRKLQSEEMAMRGGRPVADDSPGGQQQMGTPNVNAVHGDEVLWSRGVKNIFLGAGLVVFFYFLFGGMRVASIGLLVAIYGAGQVFVAKRSVAARPQQGNDREEPAADGPRPEQDGGEDYEEVK